MQVSPKAAPCGAEITDVDLTQQLLSEQVTEIRQAWLKHHVLVFPEQELSVDDLVRFTLYFGNFGEDPFFD